MPHLTQHEMLDLQEHIRGEAATSHTCSQFAQMATDPDLKAFCQEEARVSASNVQRLMSLFQKNGTH